ncbi:hypothetical protein [Polaromonas sp.]|jgi:hypothetical protein|uniref:hypothetical protein n=1 Tax=Polaromonas sp. TaxID=1869339 RepID=UPI002BB43131|nr:hypothetical protein [Polaromonas sp.]HQS32985.1 hypothetical protein [Polaromonas sp.]HQS91015.1 hypothetical protein [Polaromonas sp.]
MAKIHYFQRFSSKENTVTNNTLQLFARIYNHSHELASEFLSGLVEAEISIGLEIRQQQKMGDAIPDGTLVQRSFSIMIEAKVDAGVDEGQLLRHCQKFTTQEQQILLLLTKEHLQVTQLEKIRKNISEQSPKVIFRNITYGDICEACSGLFRDHELQMQALVEDYIEYCNDAKLFDQAPYLLRIVPCGVSLALNVKYGIYFHPSDRGYTRHRFEGIYAQKEVQFLIDIGCGGSVFDIDFDGIKITDKKMVEGVKTDEYDKRIISMIQEAKLKCGYDIAKGHRFFCGKIIPTSFKKSTPNGIQGSRFIDLKKAIGSFSSLTDVAEKLKSATWK